MLREAPNIERNTALPQRAGTSANPLSGYPLICTTLLFMLFSAMAANAQAINARISVISLSPARVRVEAVRAEASTVWSFRNVYAGANALGERVENLSLFDARGGEVAARKLAAGEYEAAAAATKVRYELKLDPPRDTNATAHVSWLTAMRGVLLPGDLLPLPLARAKLSLTLPENWKVATLATQTGEHYEIEDAESAVFFVGADVRAAQTSIRGMELKFATAGEWAFTDQDVLGIIRDVVGEHERAVGGIPRRRSMILLAPFPQTSDASRWSAETRGATVVFLSGRSASKTAGLARLSVPLAHELFHLWVPNGLELSGDYDWFYEGFTVYQSMRASVRLGYLTFQDYLDSLARAYDSYRGGRMPDTLSLVEASARRWSGGSTLVYQKGMLVAALYDLNVRQGSRGKRSLDDVYRLLFRQIPPGGERRDGNAVVIDALDSIAGGSAFSKHYIRSAVRLDLTTALDAYGLQSASSGARTRITVGNSLNRARRDLLRQIGYN